MKLKRAKIFGFKTFADRTELEFDANLIAVVGPNGCGKSNIVDAIMWGLGEPSARNLRANSNQEVIFAGSSTRKPLGFAEVTLEFDNTDRSLNLDADTVEIGRRLTRSGDSDFFINRKSVRLKDIHDLLADSGLGRTGYAIVGQKDIDAALSASAFERRGWIDEAAGVQRYRLKRHESLRRLQATRDSLERVADILHEIDTQREPLREQAEAARRYRVALESLHTLEIGLLATDFVDASTKMVELDAQVSSWETLIEKESELARELERKAQHLADTLQDTETRTDALRELQQSLLTAQARLEGQIKLVEQRLASYAEHEENLDQEVSHSSETLAKAESDVVAAEAQVAEATASLTALREEAAGLADLAALAAELQTVSEELERARAAETRVTQFEVKSTLDKERRGQIRRETQGILASIPDLESEIAKCEATLEEARQAAAEREIGRRAQRDLVKDYEQTRRRLEVEHREILADLTKLEGRRTSLEHALESLEGVTQGARAVLKAAEGGLLPPCYELVAHSFEVDPDLALAIETALGASQSDLIVPDGSDAKVAIEFLKENRLGRATFQPLRLMRSYSASSELRRLAQGAGVVGIASELVSCNADVRPVLDSLLGRILVCESLDDALGLAKTTGWSRIVTLDGEVIFSSGAVSGGAAKNSGPGPVAKRQELSEVNQAIQGLLSKEAQLEQKIARLQGEINQADQTPELPDEEQEQRAETERWLISLRSELNEANRSLKRLEQELAGEQGALDPEDLAVAARRPECEARKEELQLKLASVSLEGDLLHRRLEEADARLEVARNWREEMVQRRDLLLVSGGNRDARKSQLAEQRTKAEEERKQLDVEQNRSVARLSDVATQLAELQVSKAKILQDSFANSEAIKSSRQAREGADAGMREATVQRVRLDSRKAQAFQRLLEEHGLDEPKIWDAAAAAELPSDARSVVNRLRTEIRDMGTVHVGAIEILEQLDERHDTLKAQFDDVDQSRQQIEEGIRELDRLTSGRFMEAFVQIQEHFRIFFSELFQGGDAELILTNPEEILESGVEIEVTVPGKRRQRLELLSGGERAMSACAFLFALLRVKPSPLVILDEVDAPLDGRNVERFVHALEAFKGISQFVLITHNPLTIEVAPMWFGVTMQEPGVSTVVPFRAGISAIAETSLR